MEEIRGRIAVVKQDIEKIKFATTLFWSEQQRRVVLLK